MSDTISSRLNDRLVDIVKSLKSLLTLLEVIRNTSSTLEEDLKKNSLYNKTLKSSGKLSCELSNRLDTVRDFISPENFDSLLSELGCEWDPDKLKASVKLNKQAGK